MAHGKTLDLRAIKPARPQFVHEHPEPVKVKRGKLLFWRKPGGMVAYVATESTRDRSLRGKARIRARKAARR